MTSKPVFKVIASLITTALFGYLMYMLADAVITGLFFQDTTETTILGVIVAIAPVILTIVWSIIRKRVLWLLSIVNLIVSAVIGAAMGEEITYNHAFAFGLMIFVPYILCLIMILKEKTVDNPKPYPVSSSSSSYSGSSYGSSSGGSMSFSEKEAYILHNCHSAYSFSGIQKIENDPNLTSSQKEELKSHLRIYGD